MSTFTFGNINSDYLINVQIYTDPTKFNNLNDNNIFTCVQDLLFEKAVHAKNLNKDTKNAIIEEFENESYYHIHPSDIQQFKKYFDDLQDEIKSHLNTLNTLITLNISVDTKDEEYLKKSKKIIESFNYLKNQIDTFYYLPDVINEVQYHVPPEFKDIFPDGRMKLDDILTQTYVSNTESLTDLVKSLKDFFTKYIEILYAPFEKNYYTLFEKYMDDSLKIIESKNYIFKPSEVYFSKIYKLKKKLSNNLYIHDLYSDFDMFLSNYFIDISLEFDDYFDADVNFKVKVDIVHSIDNIPYDNICKLGSEYVKDAFKSSDLIGSVYLTKESLNYRGICIGLVYCNEELRRNFFVHDNVVERSAIVEKYLYISTVCSNIKTDRMYVGVGARLIELIKKISVLLQFSGVTLESVNSCKTDVSNREDCPEFIQDYYLKRGFEFDTYREIMKDFYFYKKTTKNHSISDLLVLLASDFNDTKTFTDVVYEMDQSTKKWKRKQILSQPNNDIEEIIGQKITSRTNPYTSVNVDTFDEIDPLKTKEEYDYQLIPMIYYNNLTNPNGVTSFGKFRRDYLQKHKKMNKKQVYHKYYYALQKIFLRR